MTMPTWMIGVGFSLAPMPPNFPRPSSKEFLAGPGYVER